jgi:UDP-GlcNAc3NAcA epimerase
LIRILNIVGARPQIIKAAAISRTIKNNFADKIEDIILHTGQHYDLKMSEVFFNEMEIHSPRYNLNIGSNSHGKQTAAMISGLEELMGKEKPDYVLIYGDTNSTLAAAIVASKMQLPIAHIEAGMRSFNKSMPEEINRIMSDHVSSILFAPTTTGILNLKKEGFSLENKMPFTMDNPGVFHCGDIMFDNALYYKNISNSYTDILKTNKLTSKNYALVTLHRPVNTDIHERLNDIFEALNEISLRKGIIMLVPLHPRTKKILEKSLKRSLYSSINSNINFIITEPASYLEMVVLESNAFLIITDSGGVQKEAYFYHCPSIILRAETEWVELVECGAAKLVDANKQMILDAYDHFEKLETLNFPEIFGNGDAANFICNILIKNQSVSK